MKKLTKQVREIQNLSDFCRKSGIPRRTMDRIKKGGAKHNPITILALKSALASYVATKK